MELTFSIARSSANAAEICGDVAKGWLLSDRAVIAIADGLGHGADAALAAGRAIEYVGSHLGEDPVSLFRGMGSALTSTRGAAVGLAVVRQGSGELTYAGVGNTRAAVFGWRTTRLDGDVGIVGGGFRRLAPVVVPIRPGDYLALWTDGLDERLALAKAGHEEDIDRLAEALLRRYSSGHDDACLILARCSVS